MRVTPATLVARLATLSVDLDPPHRPMVVPVRRYASANPSMGSGQIERAAILDLIRTRFNADSDQLGLTATQLRWVFSGVGLPDEIAKVLRLMARYGIFSHTGPARPGLSGTALETALQNAAKHPPVYIGMDCSGFVSAWARLNGYNEGSRDRGALNWVDGPAQLHSRLDEIQPYDVISWSDGLHVAVIHSCDPLGHGAASRRLEVAESSAQGINVFKCTVQLSADRPDVYNDPRHTTHLLGGRGAHHWFRLHTPHHGNPQVYIGTLNAFRHRARPAAPPP